LADVVHCVAGALDALLNSSSKVVGATFHDVAGRLRASLDRRARVTNAVVDGLTDAAQAITRPRPIHADHSAAETNRPDEAETENPTQSQSFCRG
jgi:hypothetical protein